MHKTSKIIRIVLAAVILLTVVGSGIALWQTRPTSKGDPTKIAEESVKSDENAASDIPSPAGQTPPSQTKELDLDVRDLAPKTSSARVLDEQIIYDRKEIPDETTE